VIHHINQCCHPAEFFFELLQLGTLNAVNADIDLAIAIGHSLIRSEDADDMTPKSADDIANFFDGARSIFKLKCELNAASPHAGMRRTGAIQRDRCWAGELAFLVSSLACPT